MRFNKIEIIGELAHFKNSMSGKNQNTYPSPPISTVVGILKRIYGEDIDNFVFGYTFECNEERFKDVMKVYKELNANQYTFANSKRFRTDIVFPEYLINPKLTVYTTIDKEMDISNILNLGDTNCLAKCSPSKKININNQATIGFNQWTDFDTGDGLIRTINKETQYNKRKGWYDQYTMKARFNEDFNCNYAIEDTNEGVFLWKYEGMGDVKCYQENI